MGDHRFSFKAEFEMHGVKDQINLGWCNWSGGRGGIDSRITDWLDNVVARAMAKYDADVMDYHEKQNRVAIEKAEREQLLALKAKYEPGT